MQDLSDLLEVRLSLFWEPHFGEAFFSSAYPISYRLFFVPRTREVSWWKGKEFRQEVHSLTCSRNSLRYLHIHQASLPLHRGKSSITDSSFAVWKATEKSQRVYENSTGRVVGSWYNKEFRQTSGALFLCHKGYVRVCPVLIIGCCTSWGRCPAPWNARAFCEHKTSSVDISHPPHSSRDSLSRCHYQAFLEVSFKWRWRLSFEKYRRKGSTIAASHQKRRLPWNG